MSQPAQNLEQTYPGKSLSTARQSHVPLKQALDAIKEGKWQEADRWLEITATDFPQQLDGQRAVVLQLLYRMAQELAQVRVAHHILQGSKMELRAQDKQRWFDLMDSYEREGIYWGNAMRDKAKSLLDHDTGLPLTLEFVMPVSESSVVKLRQRLIKGELLDEEEFKELVRGEWLNNFLGLMGDMLQVEESKLLDGSYQTVVPRIPLYRALGVRLFVLWQRTQERAFAELARRCLEKVLSLTQDQPYNNDRQKANDFLGRITQLQPDKPAAKAKDHVNKKKK